MFAAHPGNGIRTNNRAFHLKLHTWSHRPTTTIKTVVHRRRLDPQRWRMLSPRGKSFRVSRLSPRYLRSHGGIYEKHGRSMGYRGTIPRCNRRGLTFSRKCCRAPWSVRTFTRTNSKPRATRTVTLVTCCRIPSIRSIRPRRAIIMLSVTKRNSVNRNNAVSRVRSISWNTQPENRIRPGPWSKWFVGWNESSRRTRPQAPGENTFTNIFIITIIIITPRLSFDPFVFVRRDRDILRAASTPSTDRMKRQIFLQTISRIG